MDIGVLTILLLAGMFLVLASGLPLSFGLGGLAVIFTWWQWGSNGLFMIANRALGLMDEQLLIAIPMFILMGVILKESGTAEDLYDMMDAWLGRRPGGLAAGTVLVCTIFAAMTGVSAAATISMGVIALPSMLKRRYDKGIVIGSIAAGGALGILIPPSVTMIVFSLVADVSVGHLFVGGIFPGLLLSALFIAYILVRCGFQPRLGPPGAEHPIRSQKLKTLRSIILPMLIILLVLGGIITGLATITECSVLGAIGSILCAAVKRRLDWTLIINGAQQTLILMGMIAWIALAAMAFATIYIFIGAQSLLTNLFIGIAANRWVVMVIIQLCLFVLGAFLDIWGIILIAVPVFVSVVRQMGFDMVWFGVLFIVNMEMAYLTPPYGVNLFYLKGVAPEGITMGDIYASVTPFVMIQALGLILCMIFPEIILWLPRLAFGK